MLRSWSVVWVIATVLGSLSKFVCPLSTINSASFESILLEKPRCVKKLLTIKI
jgi:hypothetical protein